MASSDKARLLAEYARRDRDARYPSLYSRNNPVHFFMMYSRQQAMDNLLNEHGLNELSSYKFLEVGCGSGGILQELIDMGADPEKIIGIDLIPERVKSAKKTTSLSSLSIADGQELPFPTNSFDLVSQYTVFSSILNPEIKVHIAQEMLRVLRKYQGAILWYDFWLNPTNKQTRGIRPKEIRALFSGCSFTFRKITLAPPIARRIVPVSWNLAGVLEKLGIFNSHYLVLIQPI
jgi:ubiquinone/menaquinone biosynthesis C-methylase UbiE